MFCNTQYDNFSLDQSSIMLSIHSPLERIKKECVLLTITSCPFLLLSFAFNSSDGVDFNFSLIYLSIQYQLARRKSTSENFSSIMCRELFLGKIYNLIAVSKALIFSKFMFSKAKSEIL